MCVEIRFTDGVAGVGNDSVAVTVGKQAYANSLTFRGGCPSVVLIKVTANVATGATGRSCTYGLRPRGDRNTP